jgi:hypothetical protein
MLSAGVLLLVLLPLLLSLKNGNFTVVVRPGVGYYDTCTCWAC